MPVPLPKIFYAATGTRRVSSNNSPRWKLTLNQGTRADDTALPDDSPGKKGYIRSYVDIVADDYRCNDIGRIGLPPLMHGAIMSNEFRPMGDHAVAADLDQIGL